MKSSGAKCASQPIEQKLRFWTKIAAVCAGTDIAISVSTRRSQFSFPVFRLHQSRRRRASVFLSQMPDTPETSSAPKPAGDARPESSSRNPASTAPARRPVKNSPLPVVLGITCAVLAISVLVLWGKIGIRDKTIEQKANRAEQLQTGATRLQEEVDQAKAETVRVQKQLDEATAASTQLKTDLEKSKADGAELQSQLDKARKTATDFQTQMGEAKVASLKSQGAVEVAQAQTAVLQTQANKVKTDLSQSQAQIADLKSQVNDLRENLQKAEQTIMDLQRPQDKK